jgi:hypothetical protein
MKKTFFLLGFFLLIGGFTFYLLNKEDKKTTILSEHRDFAVPDINQVYKIFIADRNGKAITLDRKSNYWQLNNKWRANPNAMANLLTTIEKVRIKYVPPQAAVKNIINDIATHNIKVEIYSQNNEKLKGYYVGGVTNDELGTHMIMEESEEPFVTYIPGFEGGLRARYLLDEISWRDKTIFAEKMEEIQSLSIAYPKQKSLSFKIDYSNEADTYTVLPYYENSIKYQQEAPRGLVEKYLIGYERLVAESFESDNQYRDSISQLLPFSIINLKNKDGQEKTVKLFPILKKEKNGKTVLTEEGKPLVERYFAEVNGEEFMLVQQLVFGKILWTYQGFFTQHQTSSK